MQDTGMRKILRGETESIKEMCTRIGVIGGSGKDYATVDGGKIASQIKGWNNIVTTEVGDKYLGKGDVIEMNFTHGGEKIRTVIKTGEDGAPLSVALYLDKKKVYAWTQKED
jgi:hypothetical protein